MFKITINTIRYAALHRRYRRIRCATIKLPRSTLATYAHYSHAATHPRYTGLRSIYVRMVRLLTLLPVSDDPGDIPATSKRLLKLLGNYGIIYIWTI